VRELSATLNTRLSKTSVRSNEEKSKKIVSAVMLSTKLGKLSARLSMKSSRELGSRARFKRSRFILI